ncbi:MAG TPA: hypothetical protein VIR77_04480 [Pontiella sp.]
MHVQEIFVSLGIESDDLTEHIVKSLSLYCRKFCSRGVQRSDMVLLIARAFCAVNRRESAEQVLESIEPHRRHVSRWLEILSELHHFPLLLPYFSAGVIRPAGWAGAQVDRMWTLDFGRLRMSDADRHEIMLYHAVRSLIEQMAVFWDTTSGEGVLGLKGLASLHIDETVGRHTLTDRDDLLEYVAALLMQQQESRAWKTVPEILNLDL